MAVARQALDTIHSKEEYTYALVTDGHSKWPEIIKMKSTTAGRTVEGFHKSISSCGLLEQMVTDNGPSFYVSYQSTLHRQLYMKHLVSKEEVKNLM